MVHRCSLFPTTLVDSMFPNTSVVSKHFIVHRLSLILTYISVFVAHMPTCPLARIQATRYTMVLVFCKEIDDELLILLSSWSTVSMLFPNYVPTMLIFESFACWTNYTTHTCSPARSLPKNENLFACFVSFERLL